MTNWSVMLNVFLLAGVVFAIIRMIKIKRQASRPRRFEPALSREDTVDFSDDIIAVRKIDVKPDAQSEIVSEKVKTSETKSVNTASPANLVVFLLAKEKRKLAGYELLQTILAAGLRFGEGQLFHRHQFSNGHGAVVCSLATATDDGTFDLQNMGAFSVRGLCLFMETSGNANIDLERFSIMMDTARQLSEGLDTHLLDDERHPWSETSLARYHQLLQVTKEEALPLD